ncbi:MAG: TRAP transporter small permease subunit [Acetobacteraceae bacterium]|nr:TRAP transporter small permease subunit [Acetobacteraceae bacterium]
MRAFTRAVDAVSRCCGALAACLVLLLIVLMMYDVVMRYVFDSPTLWGYDTNTFLMGAAFILSVAYALATDSHVRVDLLHLPRWPWLRTWVDLIGFTALLLPVAAWITSGLWAYWLEAFHSGETSGSSAWNPVIWPFRLILFLGFFAFTLQIVAEIIKAATRAARGAHHDAHDAV